MRIELSASPRVVSTDGVARPLDAHDAVLLALIALEGTVGRERLHTLLWPDCSRKTAQGNLRQRLFRMRRKVGHDLVVGDERLALAPGVEHDLGSGGPLLGDLRFDANEELDAWLEAARAERHRGTSSRLAAEASRLEAEGRLAEAIDIAEQLVLRELALEHAHRRLMRLHYRRGDRAAALNAYQRCRQSLDRAVGAAPSTETEELARLIERAEPLPDPSPTPPPMSLLRPPRLIGRETVWQAWEQGWQDGKVVVIAGEPGIGKTRLLDDFTSAHRAGEFLNAQPGDARMPYATWARWLRDWRGRFGAVGEGWVDAELARLVPGHGHDGELAPFTVLRFRDACFDALAVWFERGLGHIVIDDLQYADEASLEVLLAGCSKARRQRLAFAVRSTEMPATLVTWLDDQRGRNTVLEQRLDALAESEIAEWVDSLALPDIKASTWGARLARTSGGNPFFMIELLRASQASRGAATPVADAVLRAPAHLGRLLAQRLERLPPDALRLARIAGLASADFNVELAATVLGLRPIDLADAWATLEREQIFRHGAFAHDLMLESAAASVPAALAKTLHGSIAAALDATHVAPARIAHHALEAGDWALAALNLERAAADAFKAVRHREATQFCDRAVECHTLLGDPRASFRAARQAIKSACHVENEAAHDIRTSALVDKAVGDAEQLAACLARAKHLGATLQTEGLIAFAEPALTLARRLGEEEAELTATGLLTVAFCTLGRHQEAIDLSRPAAARFDSMGESIARYEFAMAYSNAFLYAGRPLEAEHWCERVIECGERLGRGDDLAVEWCNLALIRLHAGCVEAAVMAGRRSLALHSRGGDERSVTQVYARLVLGMCLRRASWWQEAEAVFEQALVAARDGCAALVPIIENHFASFYWELGQYARARKMLATPTARIGALLRRSLVEARLDARARAVDFPRIAALMSEHRYGDDGLRLDQLSFRLGTAIVGPFDAALPLCLELWTEARQLGWSAIALSAAARLASAFHEAGADDDALHWARIALADASSVAACDMDAPQFCWHVYQGLYRREPQEALELVRRELDDVRTNLPKMPEAYRDAYRSRSPFVPLLREIAAGALPQ